MVFSSPTFLFIFLVVVFLSTVFIKSNRVKNYILIVASLMFYAWGEPIYVILMIASSLVNYAFARMIESSQNKKLLLVVDVIINIGTLIYFKYANFFVDSINSISGLNIIIGNIALPVGISFFTFQSLSYVIDVYRQKTKAQKNFAKVLLYISLFPQLIAGPIVIYHDIEMQIDNRVTTVDSITIGISRFIRGLSKKLIIANIMGACADKVYALDAAKLNIVLAWIGALAYIMQIYFDFSGYSDMAIGLGKMFGFEFCENFNFPYISKNIKEFWRRWHISLSSWFREYVYIPLGGNRKGTLRTNINKIIVFFLTGLWHGANWTFVAWGLYNGAFLLFEDNVYKPKHKILSHIYSIIVITVGFVIFRADNIGSALVMIGNMFAGFNFGGEFASTLSVIISPTTILVFVLAVIFSMPVVEKIKINENVKLVISLFLFVMCMLILSASSYNPFIYFRF